MSFRAATRSLTVLCLCLYLALPASGTQLRQTIRMAQRKVVKLYGAGGLRRLEAYQSGILISADGEILTALSYVLDTDDLVAVLDDGRRLQVEIFGSDPVSELAVLRPTKSEEVEVPYFDLSAAVSARPGQRVLAVSNLYNIATGDEPASVLQGVVSAVAPLNARRGAEQAQYRETVYVLDAQSNNPGAAGGALVDWQGQLVGILGKELRSRVTGTWLNYALPAREVESVVADILAGRELATASEDRITPEESLSSEALGFMLVPDVLQRTPPYIDVVHPNSPAGEAGLKSDDLVIFLNDEPMASCIAVKRLLAYCEVDQEVTISVLRNGELLVFRLSASPERSAEGNGATEGDQP